MCVWVSVERVQEGEKDILALEIFDNDFVVRRREMKTKIWMFWEFQFFFFQKFEFQKYRVYLRGFFASLKKQGSGREKDNKKYSKIFRSSRSSGTTLSTLRWAMKPTQNWMFSINFIFFYFNIIVCIYAGSLLLSGNKVAGQEKDKKQSIV